VSRMPIDPLLASPPGDSAEPDTVPSSSADDAPRSRGLKAVDAFDEGLDVHEGWVLREDVESAYRRLYPQLVRLAFFLVDTVEHAEEAVQDAFAKAYPKWERIENPEAYMRMAVVHTCRSVQRRRSLIRRTPPARVEYAALGADHIADVVRRLPVKFRQVVVLRYYLQLSDPEIADTLGMALGTVKSTLHRARTQMKEELS
jgi:RNA polymerase sigma factor (sigma-70 family)